MAARVNANVAIFPWGDVIEDYLEPIRLRLDDFAARMSGGWLFGYAAALQSAGRNPVIICASKHAPEPRRLRHAATGTPIIVVPGRSVQHPVAWRRSLQQWRATPGRSIARVLRRERIGSMLVQEYEHARFDCLAAVATAIRIPLFATFQGGDVTLSALEARVRPHTIARTRGLIIASARERERVAREYGRLGLRIADIPNPIDTTEWRRVPAHAVRAELGVPQHTFLAISHGRIDIRRKGLDVLLAAWRHFVQAHPGAHLLIVGSGQDDAAFARMLADADLHTVSWRAHYSTDREQLRRWLSAADVYVLASRTEGMPVAPLEAMACELPIVATRANGVPEILIDGEASGGLLVDRDAPAALAAGLARLAAAPELRSTLGQAARRRVEAAFSIGTIGAALSDFMRANGG